LEGVVSIEKKHLIAVIRKIQQNWKFEMFNMLYVVNQLTFARCNYCNNFNTLFVIDSTCSNLQKKLIPNVGNGRYESCFVMPPNVKDRWGPSLPGQLILGR